MKRRFAGLTDTGLFRSVNQDDYYIDPEGRFFIVADGMGGHAGGQEASRIATQTIQGYLDKHWDSDLTSDVLLEKAIYEANQRIIDDQESHPERADMGTTVVVSMFRQEQAWRAHIGDSRIYRWRQPNLEQLTEDHTWVERARRIGDLTEEEARVHPWRHVLSQCLGRKDIQQIDIKKIEVKTGDWLLLCSDGLTEEVPDPSIIDCLAGSRSCEEAARVLVEEAKKNGGSDNITVALVFEED